MDETGKRVRARESEREREGERERERERTNERKREEDRTRERTEEGLHACRSDHWDPTGKRPSDHHRERRSDRDSRAQMATGRRPPPDAFA